MRAALRRVRENPVPVVFIGIAILAIEGGRVDLNAVSADVLERVFRNLVVVLALIFPVLAGLGLNFGIVLGAMAGQFGLMVAENAEVRGFPGILLAIGCAVPVAILIGYLTGLLFNRCKGREMITGIILGFFAGGVYQFLFLILAGPVIPLRHPDLLLPQGRGLRVTVNLESVGRGLDAPFESRGNEVLAEEPPAGDEGEPFTGSILLRFRDPEGRERYWGAIPVFTVAAIVCLVAAVGFLLRTKLGQDLRAVGQDPHVAEIAGIRVDRCRIIAIILSMVLASIGQIIWLQNMGVMNTFSAHDQVGFLAIAAILVGGATVTRAGIFNVVLGTVLFHTLLQVVAVAGQRMLEITQIGEYLRQFFTWGVIAFALMIHAWSERKPAEDLGEEPTATGDA